MFSCFEFYWNSFLTWRSMEKYRQMQWMQCIDEDSSRKYTRGCFSEPGPHLQDNEFAHFFTKRKKKKRQDSWFFASSSVVSFNIHNMKSSWKRHRLGNDSQRQCFWHHRLKSGWRRRIQWRSSRIQSRFCLRDRFLRLNVLAAAQQSLKMKVPQWFLACLKETKQWLMWNFYIRATPTLVSSTVWGSTQLFVDQSVFEERNHQTEMENHSGARAGDPCFTSHLTAVFLNPAWSGSSGRSCLLNWEPLL